MLSSSLGCDYVPSNDHAGQIAGALQDTIEQGNCSQLKRPAVDNRATVDPFTPNGIKSPVVQSKSNIGRPRANAISLLSSPARRGHSEEMARLFQQARDTVQFQEEAKDESISINSDSDKENKCPVTPGPQSSTHFRDDIPRALRLQREVRHLEGNTSQRRGASIEAGHVRSGLAKNVELPLPVNALNGDENEIGNWTGDEDYLPKYFPGLTPIRPLFSGPATSVVEEWLQQIDVDLLPSPLSSPSGKYHEDTQERTAPPSHVKSKSEGDVPLKTHGKNNSNGDMKMYIEDNQTQTSIEGQPIRMHSLRRTANRTNSGRLPGTPQLKYNICLQNLRYHSSSLNGNRSRSNQSKSSDGNEGSTKTDKSINSGLYMKAVSRSRTCENVKKRKSVCDKPLPKGPLMVTTSGEETGGECEALEKTQKMPTRWKSAYNSLGMKRLRPTVAQKAEITQKTGSAPKLPEIEMLDALELNISSTTPSNGSDAMDGIIMDGKASSEKRQPDA